MKYIDTKITVWNRLHFSEDADIIQLIAPIQSEGIEVVIDDKCGFSVCETLYESEEHLSLTANAGCSTIEVHQDQVMVWENGQ